MRSVVMGKRIEMVEGTLTEKDGTVRRVALTATVAELRGQHGIEDENVARIELRSPVPDGDYTLAYYCGKPYKQNVVVKFGELMAAC
jgi:hypothetical protein